MFNLLKSNREMKKEGIGLEQKDKIECRTSNLID